MEHKAVYRVTEKTMHEVECPKQAQMAQEKPHCPMKNRFPAYDRWTQ